MKFFFLAALLCLFAYRSAAQDTSAFRITQLPPDGILLNKGWKFHANDNPIYAQPQFDNSGWQPIDPGQDIRTLPQLWNTNIGWFRLRFFVDSTTAKKNLIALVNQTGASEIYLNGQPVGGFGTIEDNPKQVIAASPVVGSFISFPINKPGAQVLAVRFAVQKSIFYINFAGRINPAFGLQVIDTKSYNRGDTVNADITPYFDFTRVGVFLILAVLHLALFWFNPAQKANLYFFVFAFFFWLADIQIGLAYRHASFANAKMMLLLGLLIASIISNLFFVLAVYESFRFRTKPLFWFIAAALVGSFFLSGTAPATSFWVGNIVTIVPLLEIIRVTLRAAKARQRGAKIMIGGAISFLVFFVLFNLFVLLNIPSGPHWLYGHLVFNISFLSMPIATSIYLALESSYASRTLTEKLAEVQQLSQEKQQILAAQKEVLEQQVEQRTAELQHSLKELKATQAQLIQSEKMASLGELTAGIAHEIQNPLNFVNNFSETNTELIQEAEAEIKSGNIDEGLVILEDVRTNNDKVTHHGRRADSIVKGMLEHSRTSSSQKEPTDVNKLIDEYLRLSYHGMRAKDKSFNATIETHFDESMGKVNVLPQEIGRVLLNLFNNAFYAVHERLKKVGEGYKPVVWVSTRKVNNKVEIVVKDNGLGISKSLQEKIFQPFFTTKPTGQGIGLGLSLSYDIVKAHGGELHVASEEGRYTEFVVQLPLAKSEIDFTQASA